MWMRIHLVQWVAILDNHAQCACAHKDVRGVAVLDERWQISNHVQDRCACALHKEWLSCMRIRERVTMRNAHAHARYVRSGPSLMDTTNG